MIAQFPSEPRPGEQIKATTMILVIRYLRALTNYVMRLPKGAGGRTGSAPLPFSPIDQSADGVLKVGFVPGTVNGVMPTLGGARLDATPTPPTKTITVTTYFWLKAVATFGSPDTYVVTVETTTTSAPPAAPTVSPAGFTSYLMLALATVETISGVLTITNLASYISSNMGVENEGTTNVWWRI